MTEVTKENIENQCIEWSKENLSKDFSFRKYQLEYIVDLIYSVLDKDIKTNVVEAPTGSGKSLIGIISCGVLWEYYQKKSYILVSDLGLMDQYIKDFKSYNLGWGIIKGHDNYTCTENDLTFNMSECRIHMIPYSVLMNPGAALRAGYSCSAQCEYILARKKAIAAPVTLMTYQFFLIQRNYVASIMEESEIPFDRRDFVVCDEAHKITDIIQSHFSPTYEDSYNGKIEQLLNWAKDNGAYPTDKSTALFKIKDKVWPDVSDFMRISDMIKGIEDKKNLFVGIGFYIKIFSYLLDINEEIRDLAKEGGPDVKKQLKKYLYLGDWAREVHCKFQDYYNLIREIGEEFIIKNDSETKITFNCIYEDKMVQKYFHNVCGNELLMSATIGNGEIYKKMIGADNYKFDKVPSTFDFSKSPIYFLNKHRMSYKEKAESLPHVCNIINKICRENSNYNGIIQTGSYDFTNKLFSSLSPEVKKRIIIYSDTKEKSECIKRFLSSKNGILIGPTLLEGLNFPDELCRFMICMKLPYASLGDKLVKAKLEYLPGWYEADVCSKLEQGFGRGIRHKSDWCNTYIVDGCFNDILKRSKDNLSDDTINRIKIVDSI